MAQTRLAFKKKWYQSHYQIFDDKDQLIAYTESPSVFSRVINIYNDRGDLQLQLKRDLFSSSRFEFLDKDNVFVAKLRARWTLTKFHLELADSRKFDLVKKDWGKRLEIISDGSSIGLISSSTSSFNKIGAVVEELDSIILCGCVIAIAKVRRETGQ